MSNYVLRNFRLAQEIEAGAGRFAAPLRVEGSGELAHVPLATTPPAMAVSERVRFLGTETAAGGGGLLPPAERDRDGVVSTWSEFPAAVDPVLPTADELAVGKQMGLTYQDILTSKLRAEREGKRPTAPAGLTTEELHVARQMGVKPEDLAASKVATIGAASSAPVSGLSTEELHVAKQMGIAPEQLTASKQGAAKPAAADTHGLNSDELRVARQMGLDPAAVAASKANPSGATMPPAAPRDRTNRLQRVCE